VNGCRPVSAGATIVATAGFYYAFRPIPGNWFAAIAAIALLLWASARQSSPGAAAGIGLGCGFSFYFIELFWITNSISGFTSLPRPLVILIMALLALYLALYLAFFCALWQYLSRNRTAQFKTFGQILLAAAAWILLEELRGRFLGGFPWHPLGLTQIDNHLLSQLLPWGGVRLLSGLVVVCGGLLYLAFRELARRPRRQALLPLLLLVALLLLPGLIPKQPPAFGKPGTPVKVCIIQPNIPQAEKWQPGNRKKIVARMFAMTREGLRTRPQLVVWPEASLPLLLETKPALIEQLRKLVDDNGCALMLGGPRYLDQPGNRPDYPSCKKLYNAVFFFSPGRPPAVYNKIKLVPYGEYTPLADFFPFIGKLVPGLNYSAGRKKTIFSWKGLKIAPSVCFEGVFPAFTADFFAAGANLLVNLTNDAWFGDSPGPRQHLRNLRLRALENRCWIVRSANTGISAVIDPGGRIVASIPLNQQGILETEIHPSPGPTFYARHPRLPLWTALALLLGGGIRRLAARRT